MPVLLAACAAALVGLLVAVIWGGATGGLVGWLIAGPVAIVLIGLCLASDAKRRGTGWYKPSDLMPWLLRGAVLLAFAGVIAGAWAVASDVARGRWT